MSARLSEGQRPTWTDGTLSRAEGAFLGALVGDAAGAPLEFLGRAPTPQEVKAALAMPGGGYWRVAPGQITDDGELALSLARGLAGSDTYSPDRVAAQYVRWYNSRPFDIGNATISAFGHDLDKDEEHPWITAAVLEAAQHHNMQSKANGSLMRCMPLAIWGYRLSDGELADLAKQDSSFSHPNPSCCDAVACYVIAMATLIRTEGDTEVAFERAQRWAQRNAEPEVRQWLDHAEMDLGCAYHPQAGFVKIAFIHAFRHLKLQTSYVDSVAETLAGGGDTDTNACIVGGLVGAAVGIGSIPEDMVRAVIECETCAGRERPEYLHASSARSLTRELLNHAPSKFVRVDAKKKPGLLGRIFGKRF